MVFGYIKKVLNSGMMWAHQKVFGSFGYYKNFENLSQDIPISFFDLKSKDIDGNLFEFDQLQGKKAFLVVNVCSMWAITPRDYDQLSSLNKEFQSKGFEILAFPSDDFFYQEPGIGEGVKKFTAKKFPSGFTLFGKCNVNGPTADQVWVWLRANGPLWDADKGMAKQIPWSWSKFLVGRDGSIVRFGDPTDAPESFREDIIGL
jgi:glutathione peroxidase